MEPSKEQVGLEFLFIRREEAACGRSSRRNKRRNISRILAFL
tara:strand:- start:36 stop:161 length:126 start_codon:yes stop_codon:yes gene_type:complete